MDLFFPFGLLLFLMLFILFGSSTSYFAFVSTTGTLFSTTYAMFIDAHVLVFFGFGFLMSFLYRNGLTTVGHGLMIASFSALWGILNIGFWTNFIGNVPSWNKINLNVQTLTTGDYAAATVLVSFGALAGRISAVQLLVLAFIEVPIYAINVALSRTRYLTTDNGGSLQIFLFGALFGLSASFVIDSKASRARPAAVIRSSRASDMTSLLGTLFMWCFWPSFNAVVASSTSRYAYNVTNTYLALAIGTMMTFTAQHILWGGKFNMNEIQYATLAGGVAMGAAADWTVQPYGALFIGALSSLLAVLGYRYVSPFLSRKLFLNDTCGTVNAFGIPGLAGGIAAVIAAGAATTGSYSNFQFSYSQLVAGSRTPTSQASFQLLLIATSIGFPIVGGALTGLLLSLFRDLETYYTDDEEFATPEVIIAQVGQ